MLHEELMFLFLPALRPFLDSISYICMSKNNSPNFLHGEHYEKNREAGGRRAFILSGFGYLPQLPCDPLFTVVEILTNVPALFTFYYSSTLYPYCLWETPPPWDSSYPLKHPHTTASCVYSGPHPHSWWASAPVFPQSQGAPCLSSHMLSCPLPWNNHPLVLVISCK